MKRRVHFVRFDATEQEAKLIAKVVVRAASLLSEDTMGDRVSLSMDITATHANGCPLDFEKLLAADDFNFVHDVAGIVRHIDRRTGELRNHFWPRCARPAAARVAPVVGTARA